MNYTKTQLAALLGLIAPLALAVCGDGSLQATERCDDGNATGGDGCSSLCQVEAGFACTEPVIAGDLNALSDGGFESPAGPSAWSTGVASPLCTSDLCGIGSGSGASAGSGWAWFGGRALVGSQFAEQSVVIPSHASTLRFQVENPVCDSAADVARVVLDGNQVWSTDGADASCGLVGYRDVTIDLGTAAGGPYNDDAAHTLRIEADLSVQNGGLTNFFFDALTIDVGDAVEGPSMCTQTEDVCLTESFEGLAGDFSAINWTVFNDGAAVFDWGTSDDGVCNSVNGPPGNHTGGTGDAACIDADAAAAAVGNGQIDAYLCTGAIDLTTIQGAALAFRLNYQVVSDADGGDVFDVLAAGTAVPPSAATIGAFTTVHSHGGTNAGQIGLIPGEHVRVDLSPLDGLPSAYVCFRYGARDDWHAQIDDVALVAASCALPPDTDGDGIADDTDNCTLVANPNQEDTDGDGHGNRCDTDINDDCIVNAMDLGLLKSVFFTSDADADFNGDNVVNAIDLGIFRQSFFQPPGPSAAGALCDP